MKIQNLDMAAALIVATDQEPTLTDPREGLVNFVFPSTEGIRDAAVSYYSDDLYLPAKKLLRVRGALYKKLREVK